MGIEVLRAGLTTAEVAALTMRGECVRCFAVVRCRAGDTHLADCDEPWDSPVRHVRCPNPECFKRIRVFYEHTLPAWSGGGAE